MDFLYDIRQGQEYYDKRMYDYAQKCFDKAISADKQAEYIVAAIKQSYDFNTLFWNGIDDFYNHITMLENLMRRFQSNQINKDIYDYIMLQMADFETLYLKTLDMNYPWVTYSPLDIEERNHMVIDTIDKLKDILKEKEEDLQSIVDSIEWEKAKMVLGYEVHKPNISLVICWCYITLMTEMTYSSIVKEGTTATSYSTYYGTKTVFNQNESLARYRYLRLNLIRKLNYYETYASELIFYLSKSGYTEDVILQVQREFQRRVYAMHQDKKELNSILGDAFVSRNILNVPKPDSENKNVLVYGILCLVLGYYGAHSFYAGLRKKAIIQLVLGISTIGIIVSWPWSVIDLIKVIIARKIPSK